MAAKKKDTTTPAPEVDPSIAQFVEGAETGTAAGGEGEQASGDTVESLTAINEQWAAAYEALEAEKNEQAERLAKAEKELEAARGRPTEGTKEDKPYTSGSEMVGKYPKNLDDMPSVDQLNGVQ